MGDPTPLGMDDGGGSFLTPTSGISMSTNFASESPNTYRQVAQFFRKKRTDSFATGHAVRYSGTDRGTPNAVTFTSNPAGREVQRGMIGAGEFVVDPMQKLQEDVSVNKFSKAPSMSDSGKESTASIRSRGISAYKKMAKEQSKD